MSMEQRSKNGKLRAGWIITFLASVAFMAYSVIDASIPLLGEEQYVGKTYASLQVTDPKVANIIWHDTVLFGISLFAISLIMAVLSWRELSRGSRLAWYVLLLWGVGFFIAALVAHAPIGNTSFSHVGPATILLIIYLVGLGISANSVLKR